MARFCTRCGTGNEDDATFCEQCGQPLAKPQQTYPPGVGAGAAQTPTDPTAALRKPARRGLLIGAIVGVLVIVLVVVGLALTLGGDARPSGGEVKSLTQQWLEQRRDALIANACLGNFNYSQNPVQVAAWDTDTQQWMATLVKAGVYNAPQQIQGGFGGPNLSYSYGPKAAQYIRNGQLCLASGITIGKVELAPEKKVLGDLEQQAGSVAHIDQRLLEQVALAKVTLAWEGVPDWADSPTVRAQWQAQPMTHEVRLYHEKNGRWTLASPEQWMRWRMAVMLAMTDVNRAGHASGGGQFNSYQRYVLRSQIEDGLALSDAARIGLAEFYMNVGHWPSNNASAGLPAAASINGNYVSSVKVEPQGIIRIRYGNKAESAIAGRVLVLAGTDVGAITWTCRQPANGADGVPRDLLPGWCRR